MTQPAKPPGPSPTTQIVHADRRLGEASGGVHFPVHPSTQYAFDTVEELIAVFQNRKKAASYARQGTPTTAALEAKLAMLDEGTGAIAFSSGMAAIATTFLTLLKTGDHLVVGRHIFGNTASLVDSLEGMGVAVSRVDASDADEVRGALRENTRIVFVESVANPGTQIPAFDALGPLLRKRGIVFAVDNTVLSPVLFKPRSVGADLVIHSLSKSMAGQGQAMGGAVVDTGLFDWAAYPNINDAYRSIDPKQQGLTQIRKKGLRDMGARLSSQEAHAVSLGLETLALRLRQISDTALSVARFLAEHPAVSHVAYPMLESHPQHQLARKHFAGGSWMMAVELRNGDDCLAVINRLQLFLKATGLGDTRSLVIPIAHTIFFEAGPVKRAEYGIRDGLIRLSIGLESADDLQADLAQALS